MNSYDECGEIVGLDLDPIKVKLMHKQSGENWTLQKANAVEAEYRRFLYLTKTFPQESISPTSDVDIFWHYHILDTMKYAKDCQEVFGYFLHHFPYVGMRGEDDLRAQHEMDKRTRALYDQTFSASAACGERGEVAVTATASDGKLAWCSVTAKQAWCSVTAKQSWCSVTAKPAWCSVTAKPAWCSVTAKAARSGAAEPVWCSVTAKPASPEAAERAWCSVTAKAASPEAAERAWCSVTAKAASPGAAERAWCSVTAKAASPEAAERAWCSVTGKQAWCSVTRAPDFFATRPRLQQDLIAA
jgi:hypothetical protein